LKQIYITRIQNETYRPVVHNNLQLRATVSTH